MGNREVVQDILKILPSLPSKSQTELKEGISAPKNDGQHDRFIRGLVGDDYDDPEPIRLFPDGVHWGRDEAPFRIDKEYMKREWQEKSRENNHDIKWEDFIPEKCAWYQSYHFGSPFWGIHIKEECWAKITRRLLLDAGMASLKDPRASVPLLANPYLATRSAFMYLFLHELFHHQIDVAASILEIVKNDRDLYINYYYNVYIKTFIAPGALEEALANRYLYGRNKECDLDRTYLYASLKGQGAGYRDFDLYSGDNFWEGRRTIMNQIFEGRPDPSLERPIEQILEGATVSTQIKGWRVPIWLHQASAPSHRIFPRDAKRGIII